MPKYSDPSIPSDDNGGTHTGATLETDFTSCSPQSVAASQPAFCRWAGNLLELPHELLDRRRGQSIVVNSGSVAERLGDLSPRNWTAAGLEQLTARLAELDPALSQSETILYIEPHSRHILHDAPATARFFRELNPQQLRLALNPTALFEPSMLEHREDHLLRIVEALAPITSMLVLTDVAPSSTGDGLVPCMIGEGVFGAELLLRCVRPIVVPDLPLVFRTRPSQAVPFEVLEAVGDRSGDGGIR